MLKYLKKINRDYFIMGILVIFLIAVLAFASSTGKAFEVSVPTNLQYNLDGELIFDSLTLEQKIAQMVIAYGKDENAQNFQNMLIGGVFLSSRESKDSYLAATSLFQENAQIPFFVTADLEGCRNPFENFYYFPALSDIDDVTRAYRLGVEQAVLLKGLGFNMNFAPVVDLEDNIWQCRTFSGSAEEIAAKATSYIEGLHYHGVLAVSKHYPGKTLAREDPHFKSSTATITSNDLLPFQATMENDVDGVMVSNLIVDGEVDSKGKPALTSLEVSESLQNSFTGLVISDEIGMLGLKEYYTQGDVVDYKQMFIDVFNANDMVVIFDRSPENLYWMIEIVSKAVSDGKISMDKIDNSVENILSVKGVSFE